MNEVLKNGGIGGDAYSGANQHGDVVLVPVLLARPVRSVQIDL